MKKSFFLILLVAFLNCTAFGQTFKITEVRNYHGLSQSQIKKNKKLIGTEINLTFTDNDVRVSMSDGKGGYTSKLLQKKGNNIYRKSTILGDPDNWDSYDEIELDTFMGYIRGFTYTHIHHGDFGGGFKAKRK